MLRVFQPIIGDADRRGIAIAVRHQLRQAPAPTDYESLTRKAQMAAVSRQYASQGLEASLADNDRSTQTTIAGRYQHGQVPAPTHYESLRQAAQMAAVGRQYASQGLETSLADNDRSVSDVHYEYLWQWREIEAVLQAGAMNPVDGPPVYKMSQLFLNRCLKELTNDEKEDMILVSGLQQEESESIVLGDIIKCDLDHRSVSRVHADPEALFRTMLKLRETGSALHGWFHSHPGGGKSAQPSATDIHTQRQMESHGYPAIGAVFVRDGHIRFFSVTRPFRIEIHGKGVKNVDGDPFLYQIVL